MRVNLKKFTIAVGVLLFLWLLITYSYIIEVPKSPFRSNNALKIEKKLNELQNNVDAELAYSKRLLERVKKLKLVEEKGKGVEGHRVAEEKENGVEGPRQNRGNDTQTVLPILVIACDRVTVKRCLDNLVKFRPDKDTFPIIVSQDCGHNKTYEVIKKFTSTDPSITVVRQPDLSEIPLPRTKVKFRGYYKIARHFKWALNHVFKTLGYDAVIIVEDDLDISPDFFEYFLGTYPLLQKDPTLWCISAWNDNGKDGIIDRQNPGLLHRTDFFPGLGWLLQRSTWLRLADKWPTAFFDDWLRDPKNIDGKACIRPEISRTYSFGKIGVSRGLFFDMHLRNIQLNMDFVKFTELDLSYLIKDVYDESLRKTIEGIPTRLAEEIMYERSDTTPVKVMYSSAQTFRRAAKKLGLMDDFRSGVPRTAYHGIVQCFVNNRRVYLVPDFTWTKYDPSWG